MSNQLYHIINISNSSFLIIAKSWKRPEFYLNELANELKSYNKVSNVYFDFLLKNGTKDRFYKAAFHSINNSFTSFTNTKVDKKVQSLANDFFANNSELLSISHLTPAQKYLLRKEFSV